MCAPIPCSQCDAPESNDCSADAKPARPQARRSSQSRYIRDDAWVAWAQRERTIVKCSSLDDRAVPASALCAFDNGRDQPLLVSEFEGCRVLQIFVQQLQRLGDINSR
jgi:hypothetical protein